MPLNISVTTNKVSGKAVYVDRHPDKCPWCHRGMKANYLAGYLNVDKKSLMLTYWCPFDDCNEFFVGCFENQQNDNYNFEHTNLGKFKGQQFDSLIDSISPDFETIYNQTSLAEYAGLDQVCGAGYRKSLEFLIKDFAIKNDPGQTSVIQEKLLGACINDHLTDVTIKELAKRGAWLGNDETHYVRKWPGKDIQDLKAFIELTVYWILAQEKTALAIQSMTRP